MKVCSTKKGSQNLIIFGQRLFSGVASSLKLSSKRPQHLSLGAKLQLCQGCYYIINYINCLSVVPLTLNIKKSLYDDTNFEDEKEIQWEIKIVTKSLDMKNFWEENNLNIRHLHQRTPYHPHLLLHHILRQRNSGLWDVINNMIVVLSYLDIYSNFMIWIISLKVLNSYIYIYVYPTFPCLLPFRNNNVIKVGAAVNCKMAYSGTWGRM